jgi:hypothetical protein
MPTMIFDEFGMPVWTNGPDASGHDPEPIGAAIAAVNSIGTPQNLIVDYRQQPADFQPVGPPPSADDPRNFLLNPNDESREYATGPQDPGPVGNMASAISGPSDAFTAAQGGVPQSAPSAAPVPASSPVPGVKPAKAGKMDPLAAANAQVDNATVQVAQAQIDVGLAANEAARALAERRAMAQDDHAARNAQSDAQFQAARDRAQQDADAETAKWMADLEAKAKEEPNPKRWFANQSSFGKVMWLASLAFGTKAAASAPGVQNIGLAMMREEMDKDMSEQKARLARELDAVKQRGGVIDKKQAQRLAFLKDDHSIRAGQLLALEKASMERANAPGAADDQMAFMAAHKYLSEQRLATAATRATQAYQSREAQLTRGHAAAMQRNAQAFEREQNQLNRDEHAAKDALDRAFQLQKESAAGIKAGKDLASKQQTFDPESTGLTTKDGKPVTMAVTDDKKSERYSHVNTLADTAQKVNAELDLVRKANEDGTLMSRLLNGDTELAGAVTRLGYSAAKDNDPRGIVTDADFANGIKSALGLRMDTATGRFSVEINAAAMGKAGTKEYVREALTKASSRLEARTNASINAAVPVEEGGGQLVWRAKNRNSVDAQTETLAQQEARVTGKSDTDADRFIPSGRGAPELENADDLKRARAAAEAGATNALPKYTRDPQGKSRGDVVTEAVKTFETLAPDKIDTLSRGYLDLAQGDRRAVLEIEDAAQAARTKAKEREDKVIDTLARSGLGQVMPSREDVAEQLTRSGLGRMKEDETYVTQVLEAVEAIRHTPRFQIGIKK